MLIYMFGWKNGQFLMVNVKDGEKNTRELILNITIFRIDLNILNMSYMNIKKDMEELKLRCMNGEINITIFMVIMIT